MCDAEEKYGSMGKLQEQMTGQEKPMQASIDLMCYLANAGERHEGRKADVTPEWLRANLSPKQLGEARIKCQQALIVGMHRECAEDEDVEVDAVLEEIRKKKAQSEAEENP